MHSTKSTARQLLDAALRNVPPGRPREWLLRLLREAEKQKKDGLGCPSPNPSK